MKLSATHIFNCIFLTVKFGPTSCEDIPLALYICDLILETDQDVTLDISRNTDFKYSSHCSSLLLDYSHARYTVLLEQSFS